MGMLKFKKIVNQYFISNSYVKPRFDKKLKICYFEVPKYDTKSFILQYIDMTKKWVLGEYEIKEAVLGLYKFDKIDDTISSVCDWLWE